MQYRCQVKVPVRIAIRRYQMRDCNGKNVVKTAAR